MEKFYRSVIEQFRDPMIIHIERIDIDSKTFFAPPSSASIVKFIIDHQSHISFYFSKQDSAADQRQQQAVRDAALPKREVEINMFISDRGLSNARKIIDRELKNLVTTPGVRQRLLDTALDKSSEVIKSKPPNHKYSIEISVCARVSITFFFEETRVPVFDDSLCRVFGKYSTPVPDSKTCSICLDDIIDGELGPEHVFLQECLHKFHSICISEWMMKRANNNARVCPNCRCHIKSPPRPFLPKVYGSDGSVHLLI